MRIGLLILFALFWAATGVVAQDHALDTISHAISNHDAEIEVLQEKLRTQEELVESLQKQIKETQKASLSNSSASERLLKAEVQKLQTHANDSSKSLAQYKKKIEELEQQLESQSQSLATLQAVFNTMMEALELDNPTTNNPYTVKNGDSLGKIALQHHTTIAEIKKLNNLKNDKINIGQRLKLPQ